jgi:hypothetical protein
MSDEITAPELSADGDYADYMGRKARRGPTRRLKREGAQHG